MWRRSSVFIWWYRTLINALSGIVSRTITSLRKSFVANSKLASHRSNLKLGVLVIIDEGSSFDWSLIILTVVALAMTGAKNARLEAFTVLLQTGRFLTGAALCMLFVRYLFPIKLSLQQILALNCARTTVSWHSYWRCFCRGIGGSVDFWPERTWSFLKCLLHSLLS